MAERISRKVPIQWIQTIKDDGTYEFNPDPNVYSLQKNVPSTSKINFQNILINNTDPTNPLSSSFATTASYAETASFATTASYAETASYVTLAQTASYVTLAQTASYVTLAQTASYVTLAQTASYVTLAQTASFVQTAQTASYVLNAISSSFASTASFVLSSSFATTASFVVSASRAVSSSFASTASFVTTAQTASFTPNALITASVSSNTITFTNGNNTTFTLTVNTGSGATPPGGSTTEMQYNNAGTFGGTSALTFDGTTITANPITATGYFIPQNAVGGLSTVGADYTITEPGIYRFTGMNSGGAYYINFPNPTTPEDGQIIIIINADTTYAGYYGTTYSPEDALGGAITVIGAGTVDTFVNMEGIWIRTSRRP